MYQALLGIIAQSGELKSITIDSLNNGDPFYFIGEFSEGVHYFFSSVGDKIVPASDPDITTWYAGIGNADGDIDEDIKQLRIYDVDSPANVQLDTEFNVTGNYVLLGGKIVVDAYNGSSWIKISTGAYVQCADGTFTIPVTLPSASFGVNTVVTIRCYDYETYGLNGSDTSNVVSTVTLNAISDVTATIAKTIGGSFNGVGATVKYKLHSEPTIWTTAGSATVDTGAKTWTYSLNIPVAGTYDVGVFDSTNEDGNAVQENIVVAQNKLTGIVLAEVYPSGQIYDIVNIQSDFTGRNVLFSTGNIGSNYARIASNGDKICVGLIHSSLKIYSKTGTLLNTTALTSLQDVTMDATHLYVACQTGTTITVRKYLLSNYSFVAETANLYSGSDPYFKYGRSLCDGGSYVYLHGTYDSYIRGLYARKILKSNLSVAAVGNSSNGYPEGTSVTDITIGGSTLYFFPSLGAAVHTQPDTLAGETTSTGRNGGDKFGFYVNSKVYSRKYGSATKIVEQLTNGTESDVYTSAGKDIMDASLILY